MPALPEHVRGWSIPAHENRPPLGIIAMGGLYLAGDLNDALTVMNPRHAIVETEPTCTPDVILVGFETSGGRDKELRAAAAVLHLCAIEAFDGGEEDNVTLSRFTASTLAPNSLAILRELGLKAEYTATDFTAPIPYVQAVAIGRFPEFAQAQPISQMASVAH